MLGLRSGLLGLGGSNAKSGGNPDELETPDFFSANVSVVAGKWNPLGTFTVDAQEEYLFGQGAKGDNPHNQGYAYVLLKDNQGTPLEVPGKVRLVRSNAHESRMDTVLEKAEAVMHGSKTDVNSRMPLPLQNHKPAKKDDKLMLTFMPDADAVIVPANCDIIISVTRYETDE